MMEKKRRTGLGKYAMLIGMAAGFVFLGALYQGAHQPEPSGHVLTWIAVVACLLSIFLVSTESREAKPCAPTNRKASIKP